MYYILWEYKAQYHLDPGSFSDHIFSFLVPLLEATVGLLFLLRIPLPSRLSLQAITRFALIMLSLFNYVIDITFFGGNK
jgi:hypothetical protein